MNNLGLDSTSVKQQIVFLYICGLFRICIWTFNNFQKFSSVYHFIKEFILLYLLICLLSFKFFNKIECDFLLIIHLECFEDQGKFLMYWRIWGNLGNLEEEKCNRYCFKSGLHEMPQQILFCKSLQESSLLCSDSKCVYNSSKFSSYVCSHSA